MKSFTMIVSEITRQRVINKWDDQYSRFKQREDGKWEMIISEDIYYTLKFQKEKGETEEDILLRVLNRDEDK